MDTMAKLKKQTKDYYDWTEVCDAFEENTGRDFRDWAGRHKSEKWDDSIPYQDFWHEMIDSANISNRCMATFDFSQWAEQVRADEGPDKQWIAEVCDELVKIVGEGEHEYYIWW